MKYLAILGIWFAAWLLPQYAGDWWDTHFNIWQSLVSLTLMISIPRIYKAWWIPEFQTLCALTILFNAGDFIFGFPVHHYNHISGILNNIEIALMLIGGGITHLYGMIYGRHNNRNGRTDGGGDSAQCAQSRGRNA